MISYLRCSILRMPQIAMSCFSFLYTYTARPVYFLQLICVCTAIVSFNIKGVLYTQEHFWIVLSIPECSGVGYDPSQPYKTQIFNPRKLNIHHSVDIIWCFQSKSHLSRTQSLTDSLYRVECITASYSQRVLQCVHKQQNYER